MLMLLETLPAGQAQGAPVPPPPIPAIPAQVPATDLATLQLQVKELRIQLTGLQAQWDGLHSQLDVMLKTNPARPGVQQKWADVGVQIAQVKGDIAYREARIAQLGVRVGTTNPAAPPPGRSVNPNLAVSAGTVLFLALGLPVSIAWARRILRTKPQPAAPSPDQAARLERMEHAIDAVAIEVERISESQRFMTKILAERPDRAAAAEPNASPLSAAPAPKALGAGPIEPIAVPQRDRVLQPMVTPR